MLIGLDLRFLGDDLYSKFVLNLITTLIKTNKENHYNLYFHDSFISDNKDFNAISNQENIEIKKINIKNFSLKEQTKLPKILKKDNNNLMIFFNGFKPIFYSGVYYIFISNLKDIYYQNFSSSFKKYKYILLLEKNIKKSKKVICFDENTKNELIERFNLEEDKIFLNYGFFLPSDINIKGEELNIDIGSKYSIQKNYLIYSGGEGIEKNIDKLIWVFSKIEKDIELIIFGDIIAKDISIRNIIIENSLQNKIKFLSNPSEKEKYLFYKQSVGVIFPSLYETFPFHLGEPLNYDIPIIASNLKSIKNIFGDKISYFSPISKSNMLNNINIFLDKNNKKTDYSSIREKFSPLKTTKNLIEIIK